MEGIPETLMKGRPAFHMDCSVRKEVQVELPPLFWFWCTEKRGRNVRLCQQDALCLHCFYGSNASMRGGQSMSRSATGMATSRSPKRLSFPVGRRMRRPSSTRCVPLSLGRWGSEHENYDSPRRRDQSSVGSNGGSGRFLPVGEDELEKTARPALFNLQLPESRLCADTMMCVSTIDHAQEQMDKLSHSRLLEAFDQEEYASTSNRNRADYCLFQDPPVFRRKECGCKALIRRIAEQVRAETEQCSQMQDRLAKLREDMEKLQFSRDYWESRFHDSSREVQFIRLAVDQWREKALFYENKVESQQLELQSRKQKLQYRGNAGAPGSPMVKRILKQREQKNSVDGNKENEACHNVSWGKMQQLPAKKTSILQLRNL